MRFKTLLDKFTNDDIVNNLIRLYPDEKNNLKGYFNALKEIKSLTPLKSKIYIDFTVIKDDESYIDVSGIEDGENVAIEYVEWKEWLGMRVSCKTEKLYSNLDICSHCLYEMTFRGYSNKEIQDEISSLIKLTNDIESR